MRANLTLAGGLIAKTSENMELLRKFIGIAGVS